MAGDNHGRQCEEWLLREDASDEKGWEETPAAQKAMTSMGKVVESLSKGYPKTI